MAQSVRRGVVDKPSFIDNFVQHNLHAAPGKALGKAVEKNSLILSFGTALQIALQGFFSGFVEKNVTLFAAFAGAASTSIGYAGIIIGAIFAGLVYVVIAIIVKFAGVKWINKLMPAVVIQIPADLYRFNSERSL